MLACAHVSCMAPLAAVGTQLGLLAGRISRGDLAASVVAAEWQVNGAGSVEVDGLVSIGRLGKPLEDVRTGAGGSGVFVPVSDAGGGGGSHLIEDRDDVAGGGGVSGDGSGGGGGGSGVVGAVREREEGCAPVFGCVFGCGAFFCTPFCRAAANAAGHGLLCVGRLSVAVAQRDRDGGSDSASSGGVRAEVSSAVLEDHPLMQFKRHAIESNEVYLLAAQVGGGAVVAGFSYGVLG